MDKNRDIFDGFTVNLFFDEDGDYLAHFLELPNVSAFSYLRCGSERTRFGVARRERELPETQ